MVHIDTQNKTLLRSKEFENLSVSLLQANSDARFESCWGWDSESQTLASVFLESVLAPTVSSSLVRSQRGSSSLAHSLSPAIRSYAAGTIGETAFRAAATLNLRGRYWPAVPPQELWRIAGSAKDLIHTPCQLVGLEPEHF